MEMKVWVNVTAITAAVLVAGSASAQDTAPKLFVEAVGGAAVPTFDIADVAATGTAVGAAIGCRMNPKWVVMGEVDYGMHKDEATEVLDINAVHYMAKIGYSLTGPRMKGLEAVVNRGAG